jgi:hypothetical protein
VPHPISTTVAGGAGSHDRMLGHIVDSHSSLEFTPAV